MVEMNEMLEKKLKDLLRPVLPRDDYIEELHFRLSHKPAVSVEYPDYRPSLMVIGVGLSLGALLFLILNRLFREFNSEK